MPKVYVAHESLRGIHDTLTFTNGFHNQTNTDAKHIKWDFAGIISRRKFKGVFYTSPRQSDPAIWLG